MNRKQLPLEVKRMIATRVAAGDWTLEQAAEATTYSVSSVRRWADRYGPNGHEQGEVEAGLDLGEIGAVASMGDQAEPGVPLEMSAELVAQLDAVMEEHPHFGRQSLREWMLRHHRVAVPMRTLARYLAESGRGQARPPREEEHPPRRFEASAPLEMIQMDLWYVPRPGKGLYWYGLTVLDDHSRMCLAERVLEEQTAEAVVAELAAVVERWGRPSVVLTDRGPQFWSWKGRSQFTAYVEDELKAEHRKAATKHPQTIGKVERLHQTFRKEADLPEGGFLTAEEAQRHLDRYVAWYNYVRPHQGIDGLTPADRFYGMAAAVVATREAEGWRPERGIYLAANLMGRRLVIAGEGPQELRLLWDDGTEPGSGAVVPVLAGEV